MGATSIEWTDRNWPWARGCSMARGSEAGGCLNCYAARMAARFPWGKGFARMTSSGPRWTGRVEFLPQALGEPLRVRKPQRWFPSTFDPFHEALDFKDIAAVYGVMAAVPHHTFQVLTKRPARRRAFLEWLPGARERENIAPARCVAHAEKYLGIFERWPVHIRPVIEWPLHNVWEGVSVEDQATANERIPPLLETPAAVRWVSYEPALGPVDFKRFLGGRTGAGSEPLSADGKPRAETGGSGVDPLASGITGAERLTALDHRRGLGRPGIDWVVVGGESGPSARPFDVAWARSVIEQCRAAGCKAFVKQLGARPHDGRFGHSDDPRWQALERWLRLKDRKGGDISEFPEDLRVREMPS